jgi:hypothetical protein
MRIMVNSPTSKTRNSAIFSRIPGFCLSGNNPETPSFTRNTISVLLSISPVFVALYVGILVKDTELGKAKV